MASLEPYRASDLSRSLIQAGPPTIKGETTVHKRLTEHSAEIRTSSSKYRQPEDDEVSWLGLHESRFDWKSCSKLRQFMKTKIPSQRPIMSLITLTQIMCHKVIQQILLLIWIISYLIYTQLKLWEGKFTLLENSTPMKKREWIDHLRVKFPSSFQTWSMVWLIQVNQSSLWGRILLQEVFQ